MPNVSNRKWVVLSLILLSACNRSSSRPHPKQQPTRPAGQASETGLNHHGAVPAVAESEKQPTEGVIELQAVTTHQDKGILADEVALGDQIGNWESEAFHQSIKQQLKALSKAIRTRDRTNVPSDLISDRFCCSRLRPNAAQMAQVFADENLEVFRPMRNFQPQTTYVGQAGLAETLGHLLSSFDAGSSWDIHFKVYKVQFLANGAESEMYVDTHGVGSGDGKQARGIQQNMIWRCKWNRAGQGDWQLALIQLVRFEEVHYRRHTNSKLFSDCTRSVLGSNPCFLTHIRQGIDHWRYRIEERMGIDSVALAGLAIGDVNGDGLDDVYVCDVGGLPNRMFVQQADGSAVDVSAEAGVDWLDRSRAALFSDLDNDQDQDLIVSAGDSLLLMENDGSGKFTVRARLRPFPIAQSLSCVDYNGDKLLDIYVCSYGDSLETFADSRTPLPWHDANNGTPNTMYQNEGDWQFKNSTEELGLNQNNRRYSYAASWSDFDLDGDQDLYVANDFGRNNLYVNEVNQTGRFCDLANQYNVEDISPGMSVDWGDYNNDGQLDLYVGNMFSAAGNRVTYQDRFMTGLPKKLIGNYRRFARGNTLFLRGDDGAYQDVSLAAGVTMGRWAWSSQFADLNNDGWQDLVVANGHVTGVEPDDL